MVLLELFINTSVAEIVAVVEVYYFLYNERNCSEEKNNTLMIEERANWWRMSFYSCVGTTPSADGEGLALVWSSVPSHYWTRRFIWARCIWMGISPSGILWTYFSVCFYFLTMFWWFSFSSWLPEKKNYFFNPDTL